MVLDAQSGKQRGTATKVAGSPIIQIAVSPDGQLVAVSPAEPGVTLWDLRSRRRVGDKFEPPPDVIPNVAFEPDGRLLITEDGRAIEWPVDRPTLQRSACQIAGRDLPREQWTDVLPSRPYRPVCPAYGARRARPTPTGNTWALRAGTTCAARPPRTTVGTHRALAARQAPQRSPAPKSHPRETR